MFLLRMVSGSATPTAVQLNLQPDARVLGFTLGVTLVTAILFGLIPSLYVTRLDLSPVLKSATLRMAGVPVAAAARRQIARCCAGGRVADLAGRRRLFVRSLSRLA